MINVQDSQIPTAPAIRTSHRTRLQGHFAHKKQPPPPRATLGPRA
jgi:hypothetical protein